jgi:hypothetical protein
MSYCSNGYKASGCDNESIIAFEGVKICHLFAVHVKALLARTRSPEFSREKRIATEE